MSRAFRLAPLLIAVPAAAQTALTTTHAVATTGIDDARCVAVDAAGTVFAAGQSNAVVPGTIPATGSGYLSAWDANGTHLWTRTFNASPGGPERPSAVVPDGAGGAYVAGIAGNTLTNGWSAFLARYDASGTQTWFVERPATGQPEWAPDLILDASGHPVLGGRSPANGGDLSIATFTPQGVLAWEATHHGGFAGPDQIARLASAPNGDVVGVGTLSITSGPHPVAMRVDPSGAIVHVTTIWNQDVVSGSGAAACVDAQGRVFVASSSSTPTSTFLPALVLTAVDPNGSIVWTRAIEGHQQPFGGGATAADVAIDPFGRAIVFGDRAQGSQGRAAVLAAYDRDGVLAWSFEENDVAGGTGVNRWHLPARLVVTPGGEAVATGLFGPALADTIADAFVLVVDAGGVARAGITLGFPPTAGGSFDFASGVALLPGEGFAICGRAQTGASSAGFDGFVARYARTAVAFCLGDGSGNACPCGNASAPVERAGCANSLGVGARLADRGTSSLAADTFVLEANGMPDSTALYFQGTADAGGLPFGDGLRCAAGTIVRLGIHANSSGASSHPGPGDAAISQAGQIAAPGDRLYQVWYRNAVAFCTPAGFNLSSALRVTWTP